MSFVKKVLGGALSLKTVNADSLGWQVLGGISSKSGASVNVDTSLRVSTVLACVRAVAEDLAQLPLRILKEDGDGSKVAATDHPLYRILHDRPNDWQTSFEWREGAMYHAMLTPGAYSIVNRTSAGILELLPVEPHRVTVEQNARWGTTYVINTGLGKRVVFTRDEVFHVRGPSWNGYVGLDAIQLLSEAIGLSIATEESQARMHGNGMSVGGLLSTDKELKKETVLRLKADLNENHQGLAKKYQTMVLDGGFKFQSMGMTGVDSQTLESRRFQVEEIARGFGVPPARIGYADKTSTYASAEQFLKLYFQSTLAPWVERWEEALSRSLLSDDEIKEGYLIRFNVKGFLRADVKSQGEYYQRALGNSQQPGWMSVNEVRSLEDEDPVEGEQYDTPYFPSPKMTPGVAPEGNTTDPTNATPEADATDEEGAGT